MVNTSILVERPKSASKTCPRLGLQRGSGVLVACYPLSYFGIAKANSNAGDVAAQPAPFVASILKLGDGVCNRPS